MKLYGITTTYNNENYVPFVMKYAEEFGYDKLIVYDNGSTDRTVEMLKKYPFVEVREYSTEIFTEEKKLEVLLGGFWDIYSTHTKNCNGYVNGVTEMAWVTITDFDEVVFFTREDYMTPKRYLEKVSNMGYNVVNEQMVDIVSNYSVDGEFCHVYSQKCFYGDPFDWRKPLLFRMDNIHLFSPSYGMHYARFSFYDEEVKALNGTKTINVFHLKYAFGEEAYLQTRRNFFNRGHYGSNELMNKTNIFRNCLNNSIDIKKYFEHKMLFGNDPEETNVLSF